VLRALALVAVLFMSRNDRLLADGTPAPPINAWNGTFEGHITIVDFSATWCPHCREALADEERFMAAFGDRVQLVIVDVNEPVELVRAFFSLQRLPAGAALLVDPSGQTAKLWRATAFPTMYVVDRAGVIRDQWTGWGGKTSKYLSDEIARLEGKRSRGAKVASKRQTGVDRARTDQAAEDAHARRLGVEILH
jgi:thiol-disulfide isomerase/thioredoxin